MIKIRSTHDVKNKRIETVIYSQSTVIEPADNATNQAQ